ncbi:MAG: hypothetical protein F4027_17250 [Rhodospirillaceae bacterium]|nr:hypothetical protein [Rhodospirillaceae bacterium]
MEKAVQPDRIWFCGLIEIFWTGSHASVGRSICDRIEEAVPRFLQRNFPSPVYRFAEARRDHKADDRSGRAFRNSVERKRNDSEFGVRNIEPEHRPAIRSRFPRPAAISGLLRSDRKRPATDSVRADGQFAGREHPEKGGLVRCAPEAEQDGCYCTAIDPGAECRQADPVGPFAAQVGTLVVPLQQRAGFKNVDAAGA